MNRPSVRERLAGSSETGSSQALHTVSAVGMYWVRQVGSDTAGSTNTSDWIRYSRYGKTRLLDQRGSPNTEKPRTSNGAFLFEVPIALFSGRWLLLGANGKV